MVTSAFSISCDQRSVLVSIKEEFSYVKGVSIMNCLFFLVLRIFRMKAYFGSEEQKTIFPVVSWPNLIGGRGTVMHLDIERNEIEFAHTSSTKFSTKSQIPTCHKTLFFSRSFLKQFAQLLSFLMFAIFS